jgi:hypothetical protein
MIDVRWNFENKFGVWKIAQCSDDCRWCPMLGDETLGIYPSAAAALNSLLFSECYFPANGLDPGRCGLPEKFADWNMGEQHTAA